VCVVRSLLPASEKWVAAHEERVGRFAKKSSCEGAMPAIPKCYMLKELASCAPYQDGLPIGWPFCRSAKLGILWPLSGGKAMRVLRVLIAMALASAMMGPAQMRT
jgi:hypothetical protein